VTDDKSAPPRVATSVTALERSEEIRARYAAIVESSADAIVAKDLDGVISAWNAAAERMFEYAAHEAIGHPITMIIPGDLLDEELDILRRLRAGERIEQRETVRVTRSGRRINVSLTLSPLRDQSGRIIGGSKIARDITEARQARAALRQSEQRLAREVARAKTLQSISTRLISESTPESLYAQLLEAAVELMGADAASVQMLAADQASLKLLAWKNFHPGSATFWQRVDVGAGSTCSKALSDNERVVVADVETSEFMAGTQDLDEYRRSGIRAVQSTPLRSRSGRPLGMISTHWQTPHDPTEEDFRFFDVLARQAADLIERTLAEETLRESEEALSGLSQKLIEAHEEESTRIARELHDDINQRLALVSVRLGYMKESPAESAADLEQGIGEVSQEISNIVADLRALSHDLHSPRLEFLGLTEAATGFCEELSNRHGVTIDVQCENIPIALPREVSLTLYRVMQEALQNVVKHSASRNATVTLNGHGDTVNLTVNDPGQGFDPSVAVGGPGLGLTSMKERLKIIGGQLSIHTQAGSGTTIQAVAPLCLAVRQDR